jgi:hypothetical protein
MVRTGANGRRSEMFALAAGRGGFDRLNHRIGRDSGRVEAFAAERPELALETAFGIIEMNSIQYEEDFLGEREDWDEE